MLIFGGPGWLWVAAAAGAVGAWALWRVRRRAHAVSSLRFWREQAGQTEPATVRRAVDPLWLLVLLAAVLAGVALAGPRWVWANPAATNQLKMEWAVRSLAGADGTADHVEAWARLAPGSTSPGGEMQVSVNGVPRIVSEQELRAGIALPATADKNRVMLALQVNRAELARQEFVRAGADEPFGLLEETGPGNRIDPVLQRAFRVQAGARTGEPSLERMVMLVNDPSFSPAGIPGRALVVAQPSTPLEGINPGPRIDAPAGGWTPVVATGQTSGLLAWPPFVKLADVRVTALRETAVSHDWQVLATAGGRPWILGRESGQSLVIWLASEPATETDWPKSPASFVPYFAEMAHRAWGDQDLSRFVEWKPMESALGTAQTTPPVNLGGYGGGAAIGLLVGAAGWFLWRGRR